MSSTTAVCRNAANFAGERIEHRHGVAGEVHEQLLARRMGLPHGRGDPAAPLPVQVAEPAVAVTVRFAGRMEPAANCPTGDDAWPART
jgi:hypothetical protein